MHSTSPEPAAALAAPALTTATRPPVAQDAPASCPTCGAPVLGRYCVECGERIGERLTMRGLVAHLFEFSFGFDLPLVRTFREMMFRPGGVARDYVRGRRRAYGSPLRYCVIGGTVAIVVERLVGIQVVKYGGPGPVDAAAPVFDWVNANVHIVVFATLPILIGLLRLFFWRSGRNLVEIAVLCLFVYGQSFFLQALAFGLGAESTPAVAIATAIPFMWLSWAAIPFFGARSVGRATSVALRALLAHALHAVLLWLPVIAAAAAYAWLTRH